MMPNITGQSSGFFGLFWLNLAGCGILVPWPGIECISPAVESWSLKPWTSRAVPVGQFFKNDLFIYGCTGSSLLHLGRLQLREQGSSPVVV